MFLIISLPTYHYIACKYNVLFRDYHRVRTIFIKNKWAKLSPAHLLFTCCTDYLNQSTILSFA